MTLMNILDTTPHTINSPLERLSLRVGVEAEKVWYELLLGGAPVIARSKLAVFGSNDQNLLHVGPATRYTFEESQFDETWEQPWGEQQYVRNNYNEVALVSDGFTIRFRLFDDGLGFRYELGGSGELKIARELTEFKIDPKNSAWWIPALGQNHYEHLYNKSALRDITTAHTPLTIELQDGGFLSIHEAALYDYGSMNIVATDSGLQSTITPLNDGSAAVINLPRPLPWRTILVADKAHELGSSRIMLNLNEPSKIADTSWIKPMKFMGIWWAMFINYATWASGNKHGATTANAFRYINAAHDLGIKGLLIEGWNQGWDGDWTKNGDKMNHMLPYPDFDISTITSYAKSRGVEIVGHHETSGNISHYEWQLPEAYDYYRHFGVKYVKTGYVSPRLNTGDYHSSQTGVRHYQKTVEMMAKRRMMVDIHEPVKGTGTERTWPNLMTREGVMGQEYEGGAVTPEHTTVLPFTRLLAGPLDYTPGLFNLSGTNRKVRTTLAKQLAFYVTMYSPMQMVADLPEHYENHQQAFKFIRSVPVSWERTVPLDGAIGDYYLVARKDRDSDDWYVGGVTDEEERQLQVDFSFLPAHARFDAVVYRDGDDADWNSNPESYKIERHSLTKDSRLDVVLKPGGGFAIHLTLEGAVSKPY